MTCTQPIAFVDRTRNTFRMFPCKRRTCPSCGGYWLAERWRRYEAGARVSLDRLGFLTLTPPAAPPADWNARGVQQAFNRLRTALRRLSSDFQYISVKELQARGYVHLHLVTRDLAVDFGELRRRAKRAGFGSQVHIRGVETVESAWAYLTKHVSRPEDGLRRRQVLTFSRGWSHEGGDAAPAQAGAFAKISFRPAPIEEWYWESDGFEHSFDRGAYERLVEELTARSDRGQSPEASLSSVAVQVRPLTSREGEAA